MKINKLQKKILFILVLLCLATPVGVLLPAAFNAGDAWGEWSAQTVHDMLGYVPQGLEKYTDKWKAPIPGYTADSSDPSAVRQSGYYIVSGIIGATVTYSVLLMISGLIVKNEK